MGGLENVEAVKVLLTGVVDVPLPCEDTCGKKELSSPYSVSQTSFRGIGVENAGTLRYEVTFNTEGVPFHVLCNGCSTLYQVDGRNQRITEHPVPERDSAQGDGLDKLRGQIEIAKSRITFANLGQPTRL